MTGMTLQMYIWRDKNGWVKDLLHLWEENSIQAWNWKATDMEKWLFLKGAASQQQQKNYLH